MFKPFVDQLKGALAGAADKLLGRAIVIVFALVAMGFLTAAALILLIVGYGAVTACVALATVFAVAAILGAAIVGGSEDREKAALMESSAAAAPSNQAEIFDLIARDPKMALSTASTVLGGARLLGRNNVILLIAVAAVAYFYLKPNTSVGESAKTPEGANPPAA